MRFIRFGKDWVNPQQIVSITDTNNQGIRIALSDTTVIFVKDTRWNSVNELIAFVVNEDR